MWAFSLNVGEGGYGNTARVDDEGNVYVTGLFLGSVDFDPGPEEHVIESEGSGVNGHDIFLAKYDTDGTLLWAFSVGDTGYDFSNSLELKAGGVYIAVGF